MTRRLDNAQALVAWARHDLPRIEQAYRDNILAPEVPRSVQIAVKTPLENLRSALDYCAAELHDRFGTQGGRPPQVYFPIDHGGLDRAAFGRLAERKIPGLGVTRPDLVDLLFTFQIGASPDNAWLPDMATLVNKNKHDDLAPQQRVERDRVSVRSADAYIGYSASPEVKIGPGVSMFGSPVDPVTQLPQPQPGVRVAKTTFVRFDLLLVGRPSPHFLRQCVDGVERIVNEIRLAVDGRR